ncbi:MAG TPA: ATP-binding protein [Planctomycetaceae bacterium]|jgi:two-component system phosphate regulon sensor histidine kinase PhoR|nr:ATP-binding protein [Planctomycetaceae bacterium]
MFSSRFFWTAAVGYLVLAAAAAWGFGQGSSPGAGILIWEAVLTVAGFGVLLTWGVLHRAAVRLAGITESAAARESGGALWSAPATPRGSARNLESAIESMNRQLETRIEELQRKSRQLQESTERLETVLGSMVEGVVAVDDSQRILFANRAARNLLDMQVTNPVGRPIWEVIRHARIDEVIRTVLAGGEATSLEIDLPRKHAVVAVLASRLPGNPTSGVVLVFHNVTELRRLENIRREFVSNVSHELKTPLTAIQAYAETLLDGALDEPEHRTKFVERIGEQAGRLHALIQDLLRLAQIESGDNVFDVRAVEVSPVVRECIDEHLAVAESKSQRLVTQAPAADLNVMADEEGLHTILGNLIDNAVKYTQDGGTISVRWRIDDGMARIDVQDNGPGIPAEHQSRIFERFYRVDRARSRDVGGTGLGLSIVKHLVQEFDGSIGISSEPGSGTTFTVRLPLSA